MTILKKVDPLTYQVNIPSHWKIHNVISVAHLYQVPQGAYPYNRRQPQPGKILVEGDSDSHGGVCGACERPSKVDRYIQCEAWPISLEIRLGRNPPVQCVFGPAEGCLCPRLQDFVAVPRVGTGTFPQTRRDDTFQLLRLPPSVATAPQKQARWEASFRATPHGPRLGRF